MQTASEKNALTKIYADTCKSFDKILDPEVLRMIIEDLSDLDFNHVVSALNSYRKDQKSFYWPRGNQIRALVNPTQSVDTLANEAASRIRAAVPMFGWPNPIEARAYIGELGWGIVERNGGWQYLCENLGVDISQLTFHAQARDLAKAMIESEKAGLGNRPVAIPQAENKKQIGDVAKLIQMKDFPK